MKPAPDIWGGGGDNSGVNMSDDMADSAVMKEIDNYRGLYLIYPDDDTRGKSNVHTLTQMSRLSHKDKVTN